jgi:sulfonate transport system permease protein
MAPLVPEQSMSRRLGKLVYVGQAIALPITILVLWWVWTSHNSSVFFPPLREILVQFRSDWLFSRARSDLEPTVVRFVVGLLISVVMGVLLGILLGLSSRARRNATPVTEFLRGTPITALVPIALVLLGPGFSMEVTLVVFGCIWPILLSTADGIRGTDPLLMETARVYGVSRRRQVFDVALRAAMPRIFSGIRIAVAVGIAVAVIANMFASSAGLGFFVIDAQSRFDVRATWSGVLVIGLVGMLANLAFVLVERRYLRWYRGWRAAASTDTA